MNQRQCPKYGVAEPARTRLHDISDLCRADAGSEIFEDIGFARRYDEADLRRAAIDHPVDEVFADRAGPLGRAVEAAADREKFLREGQRLDARAATCSRADAPHDPVSNPGESHAPRRQDAPDSA